MPLSGSASSADFTVLLVCTGNICRSALAERLGRAYLDDLLGHEASRIRLTSAGTRAVVGSGMHRDSALVLRGLGAEPGDFRARQLAPQHTAAADLVLTMTRSHRQAVLEQAPRMLSRTFTLVEAADLAERVGEDVPAGAPFRARAGALVQAMAARRSLRQAGPADDVADPMGLSLEAHQEAGDAVAAALLPLLARFAGLVQENSFRACEGMNGAVAA